MHFPLVGPYVQPHMIAALVAELCLFLVMSAQLAFGYEESWGEDRKKYFRYAHMTVVAMISVAIIGIWTLAILVIAGVSYAVYKLIQSIPQTYDIKKLLKKDEETSSSPSSKPRPYQGW